MKIGIDIDGVLNNFPDLVIAYACKYCKEIREKSCEDCKVHEHKYYFIEDSLGWDSQESINFWAKYNHIMIAETKPTIYNPEACVIVLLARNHEVYYITNRHSDTSTETTAWLQSYGFPLVSTHYTKEKDKVCKELNIEVIIEDAPENIKTLCNAGINVIVINRNYNQDIVHPNIVKRVEHVWDAIRHIQTMEPRFVVR